MTNTDAQRAAGSQGPESGTSGVFELTLTSEADVPAEDRGREILEALSALTFNVEVLAKFARDTHPDEVADARASVARLLELVRSQARPTRA
jgi:hypothetical protein